MRLCSLLLLFALYTSCLLQAQNRSQAFDRFGQIYRLTDNEAVTLLCGKKAPLFQESWLHALADTFHGAEPRRSLAPGHYFLAEVEGEQVNLEIRSVHSIRVWLLPHLRDFTLSVTDSAGVPIRDARVFLRGKRAPFDTILQCYRLPRRSRGGFVEVYAAGESWFGHADNEHKAALWRRWLNYHTGYGVARMLVFPVRWTARTVRRINYRIRDGYWPERYRRYIDEFPGYIAFSQPQYRPGDTLRVKAYATNRRGKPWRRPLELEIRELYSSRKTILRRDIAPLTPGAFVFEMPLGDTLRPDQRYSVSFYEKEPRGDREPRVISQYFMLEDYQLDEINFTLEPAAKTFRRGEAVVLNLTARDANNMPAPDASFKLILLSGGATDFHAPMVYLPDTLWRHEQHFSEETKVVAPDSIWPDASLNVEAHAYCMVSSGELQEKKASFKVLRPLHSLNARLENGHILIDRTFAPAVADTVWLVETDAAENVKRRPVGLPFRERLQLAIRHYEVIAGSQKVDIPLPEPGEAVTNEAFCASDSVFFALRNPHRIEVRYQVYEGATQLEEGTMTDSLWEWRRPGIKSQGLHYQYIWQGQARRYYAEAIRFDQLLNIELDQPATVQPGQQAQVKIRVKDIRNRPVSGVNLTAGAYNRQFGKDKPYTAPDIEYKKMRWPLVRHNNFFLKQAVAPVIRTPVTRGWYERLQLDSALYYRLRYRGEGWHAESIPIGPPSSGAMVETPEGLPWGLPYKRDSFYQQRPQFAPHVIRANQAQPVYLIYCNSRLVYYYGATNTSPYSFYGWYGYNHIRIRTRDGEFLIDSLYLKPGEKLEFALDADRFKEVKTPCKIRFVPKPDTLTRFEQEELRRSMLLWRSGNAGMGHYFWNGPENIQAVVARSGLPAHILGPFYPGETLYYLQSGVFFTSFKFEPGFEYSISQGRERLYQSRWPTGAAVLPKNLPSRLPGELAWGPHHLVVKTKKAPAPPKYLWPGRDESGRASLQIRFGRTDTLLALALLGDSLLGPFRPDSRRLEGLPTGRYHLKVFSAGGAVWRQEIALRRDTLLFLDGSKAEFRPARADESFGSMFPASPENEPPKQNILPTQFTQWPGAATGFNGISGILTDDSGEPLIGVSVLVSQGGITVGGVLTDVEGNYRIFLPPGRYDLSFRYTGFSPAEVHGVYVAGNGLVAVNQQLESGTMLHEVVVTAYKVPLIQQDATSAGKTITSEIIQHSLIRNLNGLSGDLAGATETGKLNIKGSRSAFPYNEEANDDAFPTGEPALRSRFRDYAYWQPNLMTDPNGEAWFRAIFPDNITSWNSFVLAMSSRKHAGLATQNIRAFKPLTAKLSLPRFAVAGDRFDVAGLTSNFSGDSAEVRTAFRIDGQMLRENHARIGEGLAEFALVTVPDADSLHLSYEMSSTTASDGEKRGIAILPVGTREATGEFLALERDTTLTLSFDPLRGPVIVQVTGNALDLVAEDIDFLRNYPYGCNEQNASRLLALLAEKKLSTLLRKQMGGDAQNRAKTAALLEKEIKACLNRLRDAQLADGSWGWWAGAPPNAWMTIYVLRALRNAQADDYECPGCEKGLIWLRREVGGLPLANQPEALLLLREAGVQFDCTPYLARLDTLPHRTLNERLSHWRLQQHCGRPLPVDTLLSVLTPTTTGGLYCGEENAHWHNRRAANTLLAYDIARAAGWEHITRRIRRYWLESRAAAQRRNTIETAKILQRMLPELLSQSDTLRANHLGINGVPVSDFPYKWVSSAGATAVTLVKSGDSPLFVSAYQQWQNPAPEPRNDLFGVESWLEQGNRRVDSVRRGETAELVLRVQVRQSAEYAMLEAPIPAGCSYGDKTRVIRPETHREYFRDRTAIFFEFLPAGRYEFRIPLEPRFTGRFTLNPARFEQMYFPVFFGRNAVNVVNVF